MQMTKREMEMWTKLDASEQIFFARELEHVRGKAYDKKYGELKARSFIPLDTEVDPADEMVTYEQYDMVGTAAIVTDYAEDFPRADVLGKLFSHGVISLGSSYAYNVQEIRAAAKARKPLQQRRANAARRAIEERIDTIAAFGHTPSGLPGFLNHPNVSAYTVPADGVGASAAWSAKTPDLILRDMNGIAHFVVTNTKEVEKPDSLLLPTSRYLFIASKRIGDGSSDTILDHFMQKQKYIKSVDPWVHLETAGSGSGTRMMAYRKDGDCVQLCIPQEFEQFAPEMRGMAFKVACHARHGGIEYRYPLSAAYGDLI